MSQQAQWKPAGGAGMTYSPFSAELTDRQAVWGASSAPWGVWEAVLDTPRTIFRLPQMVWGVQSAAWGACRTVFRAPRAEACLDPVQGTRGCPDSTRDGLPWLHFGPNRPFLPSNQGHSTTEQGHCVTNQGHSVTEQGHCVVSQTYSFGRFRGQQPLTTACAAAEAVRP